MSSSKGADYLARRTSEEIGKTVRALDGSGHAGRIVAGDISTGQWDIECEDGVTRTFKGPELAYTEPDPQTAS